jgi:hypothetical protein
LQRRGRRGGSKNNLSTMQAKKRTRFAVNRLRNYRRFWVALRQLLQCGRTLDRRSSGRHRFAGITQVVDMAGKR